MARPREFDEDLVLDRAMELFWDRGYQRTSVDDLVVHTGLNRASLYNVFGGKRELFVAALNRYQYREHLALIEMLRRPGPAKAVLRAAVQRVAQEVIPRGCLITNTAIELAHFDQEVGDRVVESWQWLEDALSEVVARGQKAGEIDTRHTPRQVATFLVGTIQGLGVLGKANADGDELAAVADLALAILD